MKSSIDLNSYFTHDSITYYSCDDERYKNDEECKKLIPSTIKETIPETNVKTTILIESDKDETIKKKQL